MKKLITLLAVAGLVLALAPAVWAQLVSAPGGFTPPAGLNEGDTYHLAFVSSTVTNATSTDIADYNTHVQSAADAAGIGSGAGVTWKAIASTATVHAKDNAPVSGPVYLVDGTTKVADEAAFYTSSHLEPIDKTETGAAASTTGYGAWEATAVFSGSDANSGGMSANGGLGVPNTSVWCGLHNNTVRAWLLWEHNQADINHTLPLYGLSEPLTVSTPSTPGTMIMIQ